MPSVISDLAERIGDIFYAQLKTAGLNTKVAPLYAHVLIGMVTMAGRWWMENPKLKIETVAAHVAAIGWMGLRHIPKDPRFEEV